MLTILPCLDIYACFIGAFVFGHPVYKLQLQMRVSPRPHAQRQVQGVRCQGQVPASVVEGGKLDQQYVGLTELH